MCKGWVLSIKDQCRKEHVPFFFKQWGGVRKAAAGRQLDGRTYDEVPDRVDVPVASRQIRLGLIDELESVETIEQMR